MSAYETQFTRETREGVKNPSVNMWNRKPYRNKAQKDAARLSAKLCDDGVYRSTAPVSIHPARTGRIEQQ
jgi:hypothetical protein